MDETDNNSDGEDGSYYSDASLSSSDSESSADTFTAPLPSPRPARRSAVPALGKLALGTTADDVTSRNQIQSPLGRPDSHVQPIGLATAHDSIEQSQPVNGTALRLDLAAARPVLRSPAGHGSARGSARHSGRHRSGSHRGPALSIDLLSTAFAIDKDVLRQGEMTGLGPASVARQRAAAGLGVPAAVLRLYELREVPQDGELQPGVQRVAFSVPDSGFSLAAVEETMSDNKRLMATNSHTTAALEALQQLVKEQNKAIAKLKVQAGENSGNARRLQDRCSTAENLITSLRQQLERSEQLRVQGQAALSGIKHEFEALTSELLAETQGRGRDSGGVSPRATSHSTAAQQRADLRTSSIASLLNGKQGERLTAVLERFADETVLSRLEQCLGQISNK